ncbi:hypothetical protein A2U01_0091579, partial [Trifolium medium]|nr:hypothetical protein [Trifolium medium]
MSNVEDAVEQIRRCRHGRPLAWGDQNYKEGDVRGIIMVSLKSVIVLKKV